MRLEPVLGSLTIPPCTSPLQSDNSGHTIRLVNISSGVVTTVAGKSGTSGHGDGIGTNAHLYNPTGLSLDASETTLLFVSRGNGYHLRIVNGVHAFSVFHAFSGGIFRALSSNVRPRL